MLVIFWMTASTICDLSVIGSAHWKNYQVEGKKCINSSRKYGLYIYTQITHICTIPHQMSTLTCSFRTVVLSRTIFIPQSISVIYPGSLTILHVAHQLCLLLLIVMKVQVFMCMPVKINLKWPLVIKLTNTGGGLFAVHY